MTLIILTQEAARATELSFAAIFQQPVVIAALVAGTVAGLGIVGNFLANHALQKQRLEFDEQLAKARFEYDSRALERKVDADKELAQRKFSLDQEMEGWRRKTQFAEQTLADFYSAGHAVAVIRSPISFANEAEDRPGRDEEPERIRKTRDVYYPILRRIQDNAAVLDSLHAKRFQAAALFGQDAVVPFNGLRDLVVQVRVAAQSLLQERTHADVGQMPAHKAKMEARVWEGLEEPDRLSSQLKEVLELAERTFRPFLEGTPPSTGTTKLAG